MLAPLLTVLLAPCLATGPMLQGMDGGSAVVEVLALDSGDADWDGLTDMMEIGLGTDPAVPDTDGDGMPDGWETWNALDPGVEDGEQDFDGDGLANAEEYALDCLPFESDSDGDGFWDGLEWQRETDPSAAWSFPTSSVLGDIDCNGTVDAVDVQMVVNAALGVPVAAPADVDYSVGVDALDLQRVVNAFCGSK